MKKKVKTDFNEMISEIDEKRKLSFSSKRTLINICYLILPALLIFMLVCLSMYSFLLSLIFTYFVLPMIYSVDKRIRANVSNIGNKDASYKKGYDDFFGMMAGGVYGIIIGLIYFVLLFFVFYFIFYSTLPSLMSIDSTSKETYDMIVKLIDQTNDVGSVMNSVFDSVYKLYKPLVIFLSLIEFVPITFFFFFYLTRNLSNHHMMSIILPDADKNLSASYQESICQYTFVKYYRNDRIKLNLYYNWPYLLVHTFLYGIMTYLFYLIDCHDIYSCIFFLSLFTGLISFIDILLDYFVVQNNYYIVEIISTRLISRLPYSIQEMIRTTFSSPSYIHGEESALRGSFVPSKNYYENRTDEINKEANIDVSGKDETISSSVIDLSREVKDDQEK